MKRLTPDDAFFSKIDRTGACWLWTAGQVGRDASQGNGYGLFYVSSGRVLAHRWSYERFRGQIPAGMQIDHLCKVKRCVNPDHLEVVTPHENMMRQSSLPFETRRTECVNGHDITGENRYEWRGLVKCRQCRRNAERALRAKDPRAYDAKKRASRRSRKGTR